MEVNDGRPPPLPPCPTTGCRPSHVVRNGSINGRRRYRCRACGAWFGDTTGIPMYWLRTPAMALDLTDHPWTWPEFLTMHVPATP